MTTVISGGQATRPRRRPRRRRLLLALAASWLVVLAVCGALIAASQEQPFEPSASQALVNRPAPDFSLSAADGRQVNLASLRGRPVVLLFFRSFG